MFIGKVNSEIKKIVTECLVWSVAVALYGAETWTLTRTDQTDLDLDLVPPVPDETLGDEISPLVSIVGSSPCTMPS